MKAQILTNRLTNIEYIQPLNSNDDAVMADLYDVLKKHNALKRFGITLLHEHFLIEENEVLLELTDKVTPTQKIKPFKKSEIEHLDAIETSWRLDTGKPIMNCKCVNFANGHGHYASG